ncbi:hypothetical protein ACJ51O_15935 [Burkholderia pyrrocinia]|uniref:hypothetical protein n=1 Tax=Burkholderia TaxID=32008 RepID=UPI00158BAEFE|nr:MULTISPECIES: hypothetical protein [Burkholderia]
MAAPDARPSPSILLPVHGCAARIVAAARRTGGNELDLDLITLARQNKRIVSPHSSALLFIAIKLVHITLETGMMNQCTSISFPFFSFSASPPYIPTPAADYRGHDHGHKPTGKKQVGDLRVRIEQTASPVKNQNAEQIQPAPTNKRDHDRASNCTDGGFQQFHLIGKKMIFSAAA